MRWIEGLAAAALLAALATPAVAQVKAAPGEDRLLDLTDPGVMAAAIRDAGYKAELKTNAKGEPMIASSTNGADFTVQFYGCEGKSRCSSYQFYSWYKKEPLYTLALVNEWNAKKRFLKIAIDGDGDLAEYMDFTAAGRVSQKNFADALDWYTVMDADLGKFLTEKRAASGAK